MAKGLDDDQCTAERGSDVALLTGEATGAAVRDRPADYNSRDLNWLYVDSQESFDECISALTHPSVTIVGLDIETTGRTPVPWSTEQTIRLVQVAVEEPEPRQFLVDLYAIEDPERLWAVFRDPKVEIVTCNGMFEQVHLLYHYGVQITNLTDVCYGSQQITRSKQQATRDRFAAKVKTLKAGYDARIDQARAHVADIEQQIKDARKAKDKEQVELLKELLEQAKEDRNQLRVERREAVEALEATKPKPRPINNSFRALMRRYPGKKISKTEQTSDWGAPELTWNQQRYAALDAAGLLDIAPPLKRELAERGLTERAEHEYALVWERALGKVRAKGSEREDEVVRLERAFAFSRSPEELDKFWGLRRQMTLPHAARVRLEEAYATRRAELVDAGELLAA